MYVTEDKVEELFKVEQLIVSELQQEAGNDEESASVSTFKVSDLSQKFCQFESKDGISNSKEKLEHLLSHLPFVLRPSAEEITLINPKSISPSKNGGAQCFLVVEASNTNSSAS